MANSKKNLYILQSHFTDSDDKFRDACGSYWVKTRGFPEYGDTKSKRQTPRRTASGKRAKIAKTRFFKIVPRKQTRKILEGAPYYHIENHLEIFGDKDIYGSTDAWVKFVESKIKTRKTFYDLGAQVDVPMTIGQANSQNTSPGLVYKDTSFNYNYFARMYEITTGNNAAPENILPDIYFFAKNQENPGLNVAFEAMTAGGELNPGTVRAVKGTKKQAADPSYFNKFGEAQQRMNANKRKSLLEKTTNLVFDTRSTDFLKAVKDLEPLFPMSVNIKFMSDSKNQFTEVLDDSGLSTSLLSYLALLPRKPSQRVADNLGIRRTVMKRFAEEVLVSDDSSIPPRVSVGDISVRMLDVFSWVNKLGGVNYSNNKKLTIFEDENSRTSSKFEGFMNSIVFTGKLQTLIEQNQRSYLNITNGAKAYSETLCYKIEKSLSRGSPIQTVWMPNTNEIDLIEYIDTQVKYNKFYKYRITAYQFVVGSEYQYLEVDFPESYDKVKKKQVVPPNTGKVSGVQEMKMPSEYKTGFSKILVDTANQRREVDEGKFYKASVKVATRPCVKIIELPFFEVSGKVIDDPPVPPHIDVVPYRGVNNKLLFNMNTNVGEYWMDPVIFTENDQQVITEIRRVKKRSDGKIMYSTDDALAAFEIYRMEMPPEKIEDFASSLRSIVQTDVNRKTIQKATSASFVDTLDPNKDYYYTFRAIDIHGKTSNPTDVYKVQLVDNDGAIYPLIEIYEIKENKPQKPAKSGKKLINIEPILSQTLIDFSKSQIGDGSTAKNVSSVFLGQENESVFGERFKIRLISKQTGRKIDLNVNYNVVVDKKQK